MKNSMSLPNESCVSQNICIHVFVTHVQFSLKGHLNKYRNLKNISVEREQKFVKEWLRLIVLL